MTRPDSDGLRGGIALQAGVVLVAFLAGWLLAQPPLQTLTFSGVGLAVGILAAVPMLGVFLLIHHFPGPLFRPVNRFVDEVLVPLLATAGIFDLFLLALLAGVGEELLFRGVLQPALAQGISIVPALVVVSILFGSLHAVTAGYALLATVFGAYLGLIYLASANLLVPVVAHFLYDFVVLVYLMRGRTTSAT